MTGLLLASAVVLSTLADAVVAAGPAVVGSAFESPVSPVAECPIDQLVFPELTRRGLRLVTCSDAVLVRRAYLDVIGTLPTAQEARDFLQDPDTTHKRRRLIEHLLQRAEFADYWAMRWGDLLRIKAEFPANLWPNAAQAYHRWVRDSLAANQPYDQFARELLTSSGSNFRVGPVNFYRAIQHRTPEGIARAVALTFLGARAEAWPSNRLTGMAVFFSRIGYKPTGEWKEEHVFWDPLGAEARAGSTAPGRPSIVPAEPPAGSVRLPTAPAQSCPEPLVGTFPDGTRVALSADQDPRERFADWLVAPGNPWFARCLVNRTWAWFFGRGIVHEPDDLRDDNPPDHPALLEYLERELVASHYDLKHVCRIILNSGTYQLSSVPGAEDPEAGIDSARYQLRRLDAEVLIDAINQITGSTDLYTSPIPEPFTYLPEGAPAITIADGSITSPFLALFGRSARATGMQGERDNQPTPAQWLHLVNSTHIQRKLEQGPKLKSLLRSSRPPSQLTEELYLTFLSRFPTQEELLAVAAYGQTKPGKPARAAKAGGGADPPPGTVVVKTREDWVDIAWSLLNSTEFLFRH